MTVIVNLRPQGLRDHIGKEPFEFAHLRFCGRARGQVGGCAWGRDFRHSRTRACTGPGTGEGSGRAATSAFYACKIASYPQSSQGSVKGTTNCSKEIAEDQKPYQECTAACTGPHYGSVEITDDGKSRASEWDSVEGKECEVSLVRITRLWPHIKSGGVGSHKYGSWVSGTIEFRN